jgi:hypothetical protein
MYKFVALMFVIMMVFSCNDKVVKKKDNSDANLINSNLEKVIQYDLEINKFPKKELIVNDINFIGYVNLDKMSDIHLFDSFTELIKEKYFLKNSESFYFTLSDIYKSQELLIFLSDFQFDLEESKFEKEKVLDKLLVKTLKTDNQEFGFINFKNDAIYGDTSLIKELFNIFDKKLEPISNERYELFTNSNFLKNNKIIKLIFTPNEDYRKIILEFSEKQPLLKEFIVGFNYLLFEFDLLKNNHFEISLTINSKPDSINSINKFLTNQKAILLTLDGTPDSNKLYKNLDLLKNISIEKIDDNNLLIKLETEESGLKLYLKLLNKVLIGSIK